MAKTIVTRYKWTCACGANADGFETKEAAQVSSVFHLLNATQWCFVNGESYSVEMEDPDPDPNQEKDPSPS